MSAPPLALPELTGTRDRAKEMLTAAAVPQDLRGMQVVVDAGSVIAATDSFADELVRAILVDRHADQLIVSLVGPDFAQTLKSRGRFYRVLDRLQILSGPLPS